MAFCATRSGGRLCGGGILVRTEKHSSKARHGTTNCALRLRNKLESKRRVAYSERRGPGAGPMRLPLSPFSPHENRPSRMRKREVLRAGYAMMVALLIISAVEAYRIQQSASLQSADIYRRYVKGGAAVPLSPGSFSRQHLRPRFSLEPATRSGVRVSVPTDGIKSGVSASAG